MSEKHIVRYKKGMKDETDWARVRAMRDEDIDFSDNPELDEDFFANAELVVPELRTPLDVRLDSKILRWFKKQGPDYQNRINTVLKTYVESQISRASKPKKKAS